MKAVIFDLDGVLVDSMWVWKDLAYNYLRSLGIKAEENLRDDLLEISLEEGYFYLKERYKLDGNIDEIERDFQLQLVYYYKNKVELKTNVFSLLEYLKERGYRLAIGTANEKLLVDIVLKKHRLDNYFKLIKTEDRYGKDQEEFYWDICKKLKAPVGNTYLIDDSLYAIRTGSKAGLKTIGVYDDLSSKVRGNLKGIADYYVEDLEDVREVL